MRFSTVTLYLMKGMDLVQYFPENISAIDQTQTDKDVLGYIQDVQTRSLSKKQRGKVAQLLPTIREVPSMNDVNSVNQTVQCGLCNRRISQSSSLNRDNNDYFKPCECPLTLVHRSCAFKNENFIGSTCTTCGAICQNKEDQIKHFNPGSPSRRVCELCKCYKISNVHNKFKTSLVRPCLCGYYVHHHCLSNHIKFSDTCKNCGVQFKYIQYGSVMDFFKKYFVEYIIYVIFLIIMFVFLILAFCNSAIFSNNVNSRAMLFLVFFVVFLLSIVSSFACCVRYTMNVKLPKFRRKFAGIRVLEYEMNEKRLSRESPRQMEEGSDVSGVFTNIQLREIQPKSDEHLENITEEHTAIDDLTLGQRLFGIHEQHHSSSTPLAEAQNVFVFNENMIENA